MDSLEVGELEVAIVKDGLEERIYPEGSHCVRGCLLLSMEMSRSSKKVLWGSLV